MSIVFEWVVIGGIFLTSAIVTILKKRQEDREREQKIQKLESTLKNLDKSYESDEIGNEPLLQKVFIDEQEEK